MTNISRGEAYSILELPIGADADAIRTSYKRLAAKWCPDKHANSDNAMMKFQKINLAYKRLITDNENVSMTPAQMFDLYRQVLFPRHQMHLVDDCCGSSCDADSCTTSDSENDPLSTVLSFVGRAACKKKFQHGHDRGDCNSDSENLTAEQREQLANELITEEEKKKRQIEKRRIKKKQRREKKRQEKQTSVSESVDKQKNGSATPSKAESVATNGEVSPSYTDDIAQNAAVSKHSEHNHVMSSHTTRTKPNSVDEVDPLVLRSRQCAIQGNAMACQGQYVAAIECFTKAIQLDGCDYRFFGNRSYCHERLEQFDKALRDANKVISLAPDWPKGYFRKGRALAGLKKYPAAEEAFTQVLKLDTKCEDARQELNRVRTNQLLEMGFSRQQAESAARQFDSVQQALDSLLAGVVSDNGTLEDVYVSDDDASLDHTPTPQQPSVSSSKIALSEPTVAPPRTTVKSVEPPAPPAATVPAARTSNSQKKNEPLPPIPQHHYDQAARQIQQSRQTTVATAPHSDFKMDPRNPEGLTSLWVGNVQPVFSQQTLQDMFSKFGMLQSIRVLPDKYCAFVNFMSKECAGRAMQGLQGTVLAGQPLLIKFPDNPLTSSGGALIEKPMKSNKLPAATVPVTSAPPQAAATTKLRGPVNGNRR